MHPRDDEFYIGFSRTAPPGLARRTRRLVGVLLVVVVAVALLLAAAQSRFDFGIFEFGVERSWEGILVERPYPVLRVPSSSDATGGAAHESFYLVAFGKHGADELVRGLDGRPVRVTGSLIHNDRQRMVELHEVEALTGEAAEHLGEQYPEPAERLGRMTLRGEIVDSKCHLGVMKPGRGAPHRACAVRCISGGIPPLLRVEDRAGELRYFLLVGADGGTVNREVLDLVAQPVEIAGEVVRDGDLLVLYADPRGYRLVR